MTEFGHIPYERHFNEAGNGETAGNAQPESFQVPPTETLITIPAPLAEYPQAASFTEASGTTGADSPGDEHAEAHSEVAPEIVLPVIQDPELARVLISARETLGPDAVDRLLAVHAPFNRPNVYVRNEDGTETNDKNFHNKQFLGLLPAYSEASIQAAIPPAEAEALLTLALQKDRFPDSARTDQLVIAMASGIRPPKDGEPPITPDEVAALKEFIPYAARDDLVQGGFEAIGYARKAGMPLAESTALVTEYIETANSRQTQYGIGHFMRGLQTFSTAKVEPALLQEVFSAIAHTHGDQRMETYEALRTVAMVECPTQDITPNDMLRRIAEDVRAGTSIEEAIIHIAEAHTQAVESAETDGQTIIAPREQLARRFPYKEGGLEHAVLPYRTEGYRLNDGVRDMEKMADASSYIGEEVAEGAWVYDPDSGTWYSMGGETEWLGPGNVRHSHYVPYKMGELSQNPLSFHVHPNEFSVTRPTDFGFIFPSNSDLRFVAGQKDDTNLRSFISHGYGITEFTYPDDPKIITEMSGKFQQFLKQAVTDFFGDSDRMMDRARQVGAHNVADWFVGEVNNQLDTNPELPRGFKVILHPRGVDLEAAINEQSQPGAGATGR